jgi:hypothetical protein
MSFLVDLSLFLCGISMAVQTFWDDMIVHLRRIAYVNIAAIKITTKPIVIMNSFEVTSPTTTMTRRTTHHQSSTLLDCDFTERVPEQINNFSILMTCGIRTQCGRIYSLLSWYLFLKPIR